MTTQAIDLRGEDLQVRVWVRIQGWDRRFTEIKELSPAKVSSVSEKEDAADAAKLAKELHAEIEGTRKESVSPLNQVVKWLNTQCKRIITDTKGHATQLECMILHFDQAEIRRQRELQQAEERQREAEAEELRKEAERMEARARQSSTPDADREVIQAQADRVRARADAREDPFKPQPAKVRTGGTSASKTITTERWTYQVKDIRALCLAIGEGKAPSQLVTINVGFLRGLMPTQARPEVLDLPGVVFKKEQSVSVR